MKPLRIKTRTSETASAGSCAASPAPTKLGSSTEASVDGVSAAPPALTPSPPSSRRSKRDQPSPSAHHSGRPTSSSSVSTQNTAAGHTGVKFASELDNANVEAYLEYLTHPHTSWSSAMQHMARRREVIEYHRASVFARSLASSRNASFASTMRSEGGDRDMLEMSTTSSVASAPAGFPRTASNSSKTHTGTLRKGRLGDANTVPSPPSLVATGTGTSLALLPGSSSGASPPSRMASSHSSVSTGQRVPTENKGRLSRGGALAAQRHTRTSLPTAGAAGDASSGPDLSVGGTQLHTGSTSLLVGGASKATAGSRSVSRDGAGVRRDSKGKARGLRSAGSA